MGGSAITGMERWGHRAVIALVGCAVALLGMPAGAGAAPRFSDVDSRNTHYDSIAVLVSKGVTVGCNAAGTRYCPADPVTRGQMATFIVRALRESGRTIPTRAPDAFIDDDGHPHEASINALAAMGVVTGGTDGRYRPSALVNRGQMALFLQRGFELPPVTGNRFSDVSGIYTGAANAIAVAGVTLGCNAAGTNYCPSDAVRRDQMASFLVRAIELPDVPVGLPDGEGPGGGDFPELPTGGALAREDAGSDVSITGSGTVSAGCGSTFGRLAGWGDTITIDDGDLIPAWGWSSQWIATRHWRYTIPEGYSRIEDGHWALMRDWKIFLVNNNPNSRWTAIDAHNPIPRGYSAAYLQVWSHDNYRWHNTTNMWVPYTYGGWWCLNS